MEASAIHLQDVSVLLDQKFQALRNVSLDLPSTKITGIIGPSGAGKTTLIRAIVGRQKITKGTVTVFGQPAGDASLRSTVSYMTQTASIYNDLTVSENIRYFAVMAGISRDTCPAEVKRLLETVDLTSHATHLAGSLSGGQKQRVSLAIALIGQPKLLVLDEPTVGLDPLLREQLWLLFRHLAQAGATLIISSHVMEEAERCDELVLLRDAQVLASGTPKHLRAQTNSQTVEQSFLKLVGGAS
jgi:ABC-2 type transport system ATP-binding protein